MDDNNKTFTQEEVNALIKDRLDRAEKKYAEQYSGYMSPGDVAGKHKELNDKIASLTGELEKSKAKADEDARSILDLKNQIGKFQTDALKLRITTEAGLPAELAGRLNGGNEEELKADAEKLKTMFNASFAMPMRNPEAGTGDSGANEKALKDVLNNLRKR